MTVLILGGTAEARALAAALVDEGLPVISSLAGRVTDPALPAGQVRIGGFGGPYGLCDYLLEQQIAAVVDATHPFAAQMSRNAVIAASSAGRPLVRLERPGWRLHPYAESWSWVQSADDACNVAGGLGSRALLTTGRTSLSAFLPWSEREVLVRLVEPPSFVLPSLWRLIRSRGPYSQAGERRLMIDGGVDVLVTKDSGGPHTSAKLEAAAELGVPVVIISRPELPEAGVLVTSVGDALAALDQLDLRPDQLDLRPASRSTPDAGQRSDRPGAT